MQLKLIALCAALLTAGTASAGTVSQQCAPMEVLHNGTAGMSYRLDCSAGAWKLQYSGSVPAGTQAALAQYRLLARHPDGSQFTHNRSVRVPSASLLGQALIREAVQLPSGALALRDCTEYNCSVYRPMGGVAPAANATITVTPETQRLADERLKLVVELQQRTRALEAKELELTQAQADIAGLLSSSKAAQDQATSAARAAVEREQALKGQLDKLTETQTLSQNELKAELAQTRAELARVQGALTESREQFAQLTASSAAETEAAIAGQKNALAQVESLTIKLQQVSAENEKMAAERLSSYESARDLATQTLELLEQYEALEKAKQEADAALAASTNKILELNAKLKAASLTRDLAMQASTVANSDADTQHLRTQEVAARLAQAEAGKARALAQRDEALTQLKAVQRQLDAVKPAQGSTR